MYKLTNSEIEYVSSLSIQFNYNILEIVLYFCNA